MERWKEKVAIVTGAGAGIGKGITINLVENGIKVVAVDIRLDRLQELSKSIKGEIFTIKCDITKEEEIINAVQWTKDNLGGVDILVNNAGISPSCPLIDFSTENFRNVFNVNVLGLSIFTREVLKCMKDLNNNHGHIFHICSNAAHKVLNVPGTHPYTASKHSVNILTEGLRKELRDSGTKIRVTSISPGLVNTSIFEANGTSIEDKQKYLNMNPHLQPKDVADALIYALGTPPHVQVHEIVILPVGDNY